jgi:hypothetical protein
VFCFFPEDDVNSRRSMSGVLWSLVHCDLNCVRTGSDSTCDIILTLCGRIEPDTYSREEIEAPGDWGKWRYTTWTNEGFAGEQYIKRHYSVCIQIHFTVCKEIAVKKSWAKYNKKCLHVKCPSFLSDSNQSWTFWADFRIIAQYQISWKSLQWSRIVAVSQGQWWIGNVELGA